MMSKAWLVWLVRNCSASSITILSLPLDRSAVRRSRAFLIIFGSFSTPVTESWASATRSPVTPAHADVERAKRTIPCLCKGAHGAGDDFVHLAEKGASETPKLVVVAKRPRETSLSKIATK